MNLIQWANKWGVSAAAVQDLRDQMGAGHPQEPKSAPGTSEAAIQSMQRLTASKAGARLWRNNVGATDQHFRYGLANDSAAMNKVFKSSDLIGIDPVLITPEHVGVVIGQFVAREVKAAGWVYGGNAHEKAQKAFLEFVIARGGNAKFVDGPDFIR